MLEILQEEKKNRYSGGIYHKTQIDLTYNSNYIEGSRLTHDQTRYIFETNTIGIENEVLNVDDVIETANHFRCIDLIIDNAKSTLTEKFIKELHLTLKNGTSDSRKDWFTVGDYKKFPNEVGGMETASPEEVSEKMKSFLMEYNGKKRKTFEDILEFHVKFERIHPFQDGNGRVGRLIMFKECLKYNMIIRYKTGNKIAKKPLSYFMSSGCARKLLASSPSCFSIIARKKIPKEISKTAMRAKGDILSPSNTKHKSATRAPDELHIP